MRLFYSTDIKDNLILLDETETRHCQKVLRKKQGDSIEVTDGQGHLYKAVITEFTKRQAILSIQSSHRIDRPESLPEIAIGILKSMSRFEVAVEKLTELGVAVITPLICDHTERERVSVDRLEKIAISAMKQSQRLYKPEIRKPVSLISWLKEDMYDNTLMAHYAEENRQLSQINPLGRIRIAIGPEGDFSEQEIQEAIARNTIFVNIGSVRLRSETAAIAAAVLLNCR